MDSNHRPPPRQGGAVAAGPQDQVSTPARTRTRNAAVEARNDVRFTTGAFPPFSTPARNRTWIPTFGGWCRRPLDHQGTGQRKGRGSNPHALAGGTLAGCPRYRFRTPFRPSGVAGSRTPSPCLQGTAPARWRPRCSGDIARPALPAAGPPPAPGVTSVGVEPTRLAAPALNRTCIPVPARGRPSVAGPGVEPGVQAYETRTSAGPPARFQW